jgi:hypothetical protein
VHGGAAIERGRPRPEGLDEERAGERRMGGQGPQVALDARERSGERSGSASRASLIEASVRSTPASYAARKHSSLFAKCS